MVGVCIVLKKFPSYFPKWFYHFAFPPTVYESSSCSILTIIWYDHIFILFFKINLFILFVFIFDCVVSVAVHRLSLVAGSRCYSWL